MSEGLDKLRAELAAIDQEVDRAPISTRRVHRAILAMVAVVVLGSFGAVTWYAYNQGILEGSEDAAPLVRPKGPLKVAPASPGGEQVRNRDKFVYNVLEKDGGDRRVERLLPPPEQPKPPPRRKTASRDVKAPTTPVKPPPALAPPAAMTPPPPANPPGTERGVAPRPASPGLTMPAPTPKPTPGKVAKAVPPAVAARPAPAKPVPAKKVARGPIRLTPGAGGRDPAAQKSVPVKPAPRPKIAAKRPTGARVAASVRGYFLQLGAFRSRGEANRAWTQARTTNSRVLGGLTLRLQRVNIAGKGVFYRVQAGPYAVAGLAKKACGALKRRKQRCFVVKLK